MRQSEINAIKNRAYETCSAYPILDVLSKYYMGKQVRAGSSIFIECPNGCDGNKRPSKCSVSKTKNMYRCFACSEGGSSTALQAKLTGESYSEAMLKQALELGSISYSEYDAVMDPSVLTKAKKDDFAYIQKEQAKFESKNILAPPDIRHQVYSELLNMPEFSLTEEMMQYLQGYRGIENPTNHDYFCYHDDFSVDELIRRLQKKNPKLDYNSLNGVPGFYFHYTNPEKTLGQWTFVPKSPGSIGLVIRDAEQRIVALQSRNIRMDNTSYYWVSSAKRGSQDMCGFGSSPGTPTHVEYPEQVMTGCVAFIEGFFKVKKLVHVSQGLCFAFQGVRNFANTLDELKVALHSDILRKKVRTDKRCKLSFALFYDADMLAKYQVLGAALDFYNALKREYPTRTIVFYLWPMDEGKGFDDLYANHPNDWKKYLTKISGDDFEKLSLDALKVACSKCRVSSPIEATQNGKQKELEDTLYEMFWFLLTLKRYAR